MTAQNFVTDEKESLHLLQIVNAALKGVSVGLKRHSLLKKLSVCENTVIGEEPYSRINLLKKLFVRKLKIKEKMKNIEEEKKLITTNLNAEKNDFDFDNKNLITKYFNLKLEIEDVLSYYNTPEINEKVISVSEVNDNNNNNNNNNINNNDNTNDYNNGNINNSNNDKNKNKNNDNDNTDTNDIFDNNNYEESLLIDKEIIKEKKVNYFLDFFNDKSDDLKFKKSKSIYIDINDMNNNTTSSNKQKIEKCRSNSSNKLSKNISSTSTSPGRQSHINNINNYENCNNDNYYDYYQNNENLSFNNSNDFIFRNFRKQEISNENNNKNNNNEDNNKYADKNNSNDFSFSEINENENMSEMENENENNFDNNNNNKKLTFPSYGFHFHRRKSPICPSPCSIGSPVLTKRKQFGILSKENSHGSNIENDIKTQLSLPLFLPLSSSMNDNNDDNNNDNSNNNDNIKEKQNALLSKETEGNENNLKRNENANEYVVKDFSELDYDDVSYNEIKNEKNIEFDNYNTKDNNDNNKSKNVLELSENKIILEKMNTKKGKKGKIGITENSKNGFADGNRSKPISSFYNSDVTLCNIS